MINDPQADQRIARAWDPRGSAPDCGLARADSYAARGAPGPEPALRRGPQAGIAPRHPDLARTQAVPAVPAAPVLTFDTEEEVIRRANATKFGLAAYFYTRDMTRLVRVAEQLEYGLVGANDAAGYTHEIPFGGFKESGLGREGGHEGIEEYTEVKSVVVNLG